MLRAEESTQHSEIQRDLRAEDSDFLQGEENSVTVEVLKGTHRAGWGGGRKRELGIKELLKRQQTKRPMRQAREGGTTGQPQGLEPGRRPGPQSLSRGAAHHKDHRPYTSLSTLRCLHLRRHIRVLEQTD